MRRQSLLAVSLIFFSISTCFAAVPADTVLTTKAGALLREIGETGPGAAVLVAKGDHVVFRGARGRADIELAIPLAHQNVFRIGSITKTFTATTILKLAAAGQLSLDDRLSKFLPGYPNGENITMAQLLNHTAGISDEWEADPATAVTTAELVQSIEHKAPDFLPGADWQYSNSGYILLGAVIEKITGKAWHLAMRDLFLTPLGMTRTGYYGDSELVRGRVEGYGVDETGAIVRAPYISMTGPGAAGALSSTVDDLFRFARALVGGKLLPPTLYRQMTTAGTTSTGRAIDYGYGVMLGTVRGEAVIEHNGGIDGFSSQLTYFPGQDVTVIVLANTDAGLPNSRSLAHRLGALAIGRPYPVFRFSTPDAQALAGLVGTYRIGPSSVRTLSVRDGKLFVRRDEGPERQLACAEGDILYFPGDETDFFRVIRDVRNNVVALDFHADGMEPARHEARIR